jgi:hypothetical protein
MGLATGGSWAGSMNGADIDGVDMWDAITNNLPSPHEEMLHYADGEWGCSLQQGMLKVDVGDWKLDFNNVTFIFKEDLEPTHASIQCTDPSLMSPSMTNQEKGILANTILSNSENGMDLALFTSTSYSWFSTSGKVQPAYGLDVSGTHEVVSYSVLAVALIATGAFTLAVVSHRVSRGIANAAKRTSTDESTFLLRGEPHKQQV